MFHVKHSRKAKKYHTPNVSRETLGGLMRGAKFNANTGRRGRRPLQYNIYIKRKVC